MQLSSKTESADLETHLENIENLGYTIIENVIDKQECKKIASKLDKFNEEQIKEFGEARLKELHEWGTIRALIEKDDYFQQTILNEKVFEIIKNILGDSAILHLHNGIVLSPNIDHQQSQFHRDIEKDFFTEKPLSLNAFWAIDDFNEESGGTWIVPHTHKFKKWPQKKYLDKNAIQVHTSAGSVLVFDSRIMHRSGSNKSSNFRRALNHQYTKPFMKQQIDLTRLLENRYDPDSKISQVLGFWSRPPKSVKEFRCDPSKRSYRAGQG